MPVMGKSCPLSAALMMLSAVSGSMLNAGAAVDGNGAGGVAGIAAEIRHRSGNRHRAVRQISHRGGRYRQTPGAISLHGSGKTLSSRGYCDGLSCLGLLSATGKGQWRTFSAPLIMSSPETVLMVINGETPTSVIARDAAPVFPAVSVTVTKIVLAPRSSVRVTAGSSATFQLPSASTMPVRT